MYTHTHIHKMFVFQIQAPVVGASPIALRENIEAHRT